MTIACLSISACAHFADVFIGFSAVCVEVIFPISTVIPDDASDASALLLLEQLISFVL